VSNYNELSGLEYLIAGICFFGCLYLSISSLFSFEMDLSHCIGMEFGDLTLKPLVVSARANTRKESPKIRNRRMQKKHLRDPVDPSSEKTWSTIEFNGTSTKPRLSVFCSDKQLYAMLVDDQNKKCLFYGSTLQKSIRQNPHFSTIDAAKRVGEELIKTCSDLNIHEISVYDCNGLARGERMQAFEIAICSYGFLPR
ncbi:hypothetical protein F8388_004688, partial [Cannabis sativa]